MIKLTLSDESACYVRAKFISGLTRNRNFTEVHVDGSDYYVKETIEEILKLMEEACLSN